jgi:hypothetical protein
MQLFRIGAFILPVILVIPATAAAQRRVPATDSAAIGGDVGVFIARDERLDSGLALEGFYEYYFSPRTSMRVGLGWAEPSFDREDEDSLRYVRIPFDVVRNWEGGAVHPFVGAGLGIYFLQEKDNGRSIGDSETKLGGTLFGGAEFFTGRRTAVKAEARYHIISNTRGFNPDGLAVTIGLKQYF